MRRIPIIYYHSVGRTNLNWKKNFLTLDYLTFEDQLKYLSRRFTTVHLSEYRRLRNGQINNINYPLVLTFDDGYLDNWQYAFPLLKKYGLKATIFISPEFVDERTLVRPNLEDVWSGNSNKSELNQWGFLSWDEMRLMQLSGFIDIQSHTMTHTKLTVSDKLLDFHRPSVDYLYYTANCFPERKPYYIEDSEFGKLLPDGYPVFEMQSAVVARKVGINPEFIDYCTDKLRIYDFNTYKFEDAFEQIKDEYKKYIQNDSLILSAESEEEYIERLRYEIYESKIRIEQQLKKKVEFLCWPHGDNNELAHQIALDAGYLMTTKGKAEGIDNADPSRIPVRMGMDYSSWYKKQKTHFKLKALSGKFPYSEMLELYRNIIRT